jgi:hypothetical protein
MFCSDVQRWQVSWLAGVRFAPTFPVPSLLGLQWS